MNRTDSRRGGGALDERESFRSETPAALPLHDVDLVDERRPAEVLEAVGERDDDVSDRRRAALHDPHPSPAGIAQERGHRRARRRTIEGISLPGVERRDEVEKRRHVRGPGGAERAREVHGESIGARVSNFLSESVR